jgi:hypothetical protein
MPSVEKMQIMNAAITDFRQAAGKAVVDLHRTGSLDQAAMTDLARKYFKTQEPQYAVMVGEQNLIGSHVLSIDNFVNKFVQKIKEGGDVKVTGRAIMSLLRGLEGSYSGVQDSVNKQIGSSDYRVDNHTLQQYANEKGYPGLDKNYVVPQAIRDMANDKDYYIPQNLEYEDQAGKKQVFNFQDYQDKNAALYNKVGWKAEYGDLSKFTMQDLANSFSEKETEGVKAQLKKQGWVKKNGKWSDPQTKTRQASPGKIIIQSTTTPTPPLTR